MRKKPIKQTKAPRRCVHRVVRQIADELLSVNYGLPYGAIMGDRLAIKKQTPKGERDLGGRCRNAIEDVLLRHLSNAEVSGPPPLTPESKQSATGGFAAPIC